MIPTRQRTRGTDTKSVPAILSTGGPPSSSGEPPTRQLHLGLCHYPRNAQTESRQGCGAHSVVGAWASCPSGSPPRQPSFGSRSSHGSRCPEVLSSHTSVQRQAHTSRPTFEPRRRLNNTRYRIEKRQQAALFRIGNEPRRLVDAIRSCRPLVLVVRVVSVKI